VVCRECNRDASLIKRPWPTSCSCAVKMVRSSNKGCFPLRSSVNVVNFAEVMYVTAKNRKLFTLVGIGLGNDTPLVNFLDDNTGKRNFTCVLWGWVFKF
jgi:hypothetical protein